MALGFLKRVQRQRQRRRKLPPAAVDHAATADHDRCALLIIAHPALHRSRANAALLEAARAHERDITLHDLYEEYADFLIDVEAEQQRLVDHALIILQFPMYWYSTPALLKEWLDMVLLHGFAYGRDGTKLRGKTMLVAVTAGGGVEAYHAAGMNRFPITDFLRPLEATAYLCGLTWAEPFIVHDSIQLDDAERRAAAEAYGRRLAEAIAAVRS